MIRKWMLTAMAVLTLTFGGCGGSDDSEQSPPAGGGQEASADQSDGLQSDGPARATHEFLEAVRTGNDEKAAMMMTATARKKTAELDMQVAPTGSDTAQFKVGEVRQMAGDRVAVASTWSDLDANSQRRTDEMVWMLRKSPEGWRVAGVAAQVFEGEPPLLLDFENPQEMLKKKQWIQEEIRRRAQGNQSRAQKPQESMQR